MQALLSHLPVVENQEQGSYHGIHGVLKVGDQLARQYGKGSLPLVAEEAGNRNALFLELWEQVNGVSPVGGNLPVTVLLATDRTGSPNEREKINLTGEKRFLVFPNGLVCVRVRKLNFRRLARMGAGEGLSHHWVCFLAGLGYFTKVNY